MRAPLRLHPVQARHAQAPGRDVLGEGCSATFTPRAHYPSARCEAGRPIILVGRSLLSKWISALPPSINQGLTPGCSESSAAGKLFFGLARLPIPLPPIPLPVPSAPPAPPAAMVLLRLPVTGA